MVRLRSRIDCPGEAAAVGLQSRLSAENSCAKNVSPALRGLTRKIAVHALSRLYALLLGTVDRVIDRLS